MIFTSFSTIFDLMDSKQFTELLNRLDTISSKLDKLVKISSEPEPVIRKVANGIATIVTILGILGIIETLKIWVGG